MSILPDSSSLHDALAAEARALTAYQDVLQRLSDAAGSDSAAFEGALAAEQLQRPALLARRRHNRERLDRLAPSDLASLSATVQGLDERYTQIGARIAALRTELAAHKLELGERLAAFKGTGTPRSLFSDRNKARRINIDA